MNNTEQLREVAKNGGGLVGAFVHLSRQATVRPESQVTGNAEMYGESILRGVSQLRDFAKMMEKADALDSIIQAHAKIGGEAFVYASHVSGTADIRGQAKVHNSTVSGNTMIIDKSRIHGCQLFGNVRVSDSAFLRNVIVGKDDTVVFEGYACLDFDSPLRVPAGLRVDAGVWKRPPLIIPTPVFTMCEDVNDRVKVGCLSHSIDFWFEHGRKTLIRYGLSESLYDEFIDALNIVSDFKQKHPSPTTRQ